MARIKLTDRFIQGVKPTDKRQEIPDALIVGLYLRIQPNGTKLFEYRYSFAGKSCKKSIGRYPIITLEEARQTARDYALDVSAGKDPRGSKKVPAEGIKVDELCRKYIRGCITGAGHDWPLAESTCKEWARLLGLKRDDGGDLIYTRTKGEIISRWGDRAAKDITREEIRELLREIADRPSPITANRTLEVFRRLYDWAIEQELVDITVSPAANIKRPAAREEKRDRVLDRLDNTHEYALIWSAIGDLSTEPFHPVRDALRMLIYTGQRKSQVCRATIDQFELSSLVWRIPKGVTGSKRQSNWLPITKEMEAIVRACPHKSGYLFSEDGGRSPLYIRHDIKLKLAKKVQQGAGRPVQNWTVHDLRRTFRTVASSLAVEGGDKVRELTIGHKQSGVDEIYDREKYLGPKRQLLEGFASRLHGILAENGIQTY
jgi:integrase